MNIKKEYMDILKFRHATKIFDNNRDINQEDLTYILEAGQLAPSSFGLEPWQFLVVRSDEYKQKLQDAAFSQPQLGSASAVVVVLVRKDLKLEDGYVEPLLRRHGDELYENVWQDFYTGYTSNMDERQITDYADKQCHMATMNMLNAAAVLSIDSCPIGGFDSQSVLDILNIDEQKFAISILLPFGYRVNEPVIKYRRAFDDVVSFIN